jgi:hypothetical protein
MAGIIATLLANAKVIPQSDDNIDLRGGLRHAYQELKAIQAVNDPTLASPYLKASGVSTVASNGGTTGNLTLTINFPKYGVSVTTANIAYNDAQAAIQSAIDTALSGETVLASYNAGDVDAGACANFSSADCAITANGSTVNGAHMILTTANVDMDVAAPAVTVNTVGTQNRPAEGVLAVYGVIKPATVPTPQGLSPSAGDYTLGHDWGFHSIYSGQRARPGQPVKSTSSYMKRQCLCIAASFLLDILRLVC